MFPAYDLVTTEKSQLHHTNGLYSEFYKKKGVNVHLSSRYKKENRYLFALNKTSGRLSKNAIHWPERRNNKVRNA